MRLTLTISSLGPGGAERVLATMANFWAERDWQLTIVTLSDGAEVPPLALDSRIRRVPLGLVGESRSIWTAIARNVYRVLRLRRAIAASRPDVVVSFMDTVNVLTLLATRGLGLPVVVAERVDPSKYRIRGSWSMLRRITYRVADRIVVQTRTAAAWFHDDHRIAIIPNPVLPSRRALTESSRSADTSSLIAIGRLDPQKGFDLALRAFSLVADRHPRWRFVILGEGPSRASLEHLRDELGLSSRVDFPGFVDDASSWLARSELFVLASRFEGFPNALCEAMAAGLPVVATDCPSGPSEIVRNGIDGLLVPSENVPALAAALDRLMSDEAERHRMAAEAPQITTLFALTDVMARWQALFEEVSPVAIR